MIYNLKHSFLLVFILFQCLTLSAQKPVYQLFDKDGKAIQYEDMIAMMKNSQAIFFGEFHDQPISHWLQKEVLFDLHKLHGDKLVIGAEMFESDNQLIIDEYLANNITQKKFEEEARLWKNYKNDYKAILEFAKENGLPLVASNVPGRYANMVFNKGIASLDSLSDQAKSYFAPLPIHMDLNVNCYAEMLKMNIEHGTNSEYFPQAQILRDATMSHFMAPWLQRNNVIYHLNGSYHSDSHEGIVYYMKRSNPRTKIFVISTVTQDNIGTLDDENQGKGDVILCVSSNMTKSY